MISLKGLNEEKVACNTLKKLTWSAEIRLSSVNSEKRMSDGMSVNRFHRDEELAADWSRVEPMGQHNRFA